MNDWFDKAMAKLDQQLTNGEISLEEYRREERSMREEIADEYYRNDMIQAGRLR